MNQRTSLYWLTVRSDGNTGIGRAALDAAIAINATHACPIDKHRSVDDGTLDRKYSAEHGMNKTPISQRLISRSNVSFFLFRSVMPVRLESIYQIARKSRRPCWKIDIQLQPAEEITNILSHERFNGWGWSVSFLGSRDGEDKDIYSVAYPYLCKALRGLC